MTINIVWGTFVYAGSCLPPMLHSNLCTPHYMKTILDQNQFIAKGYTYALIGFKQDY